MKEYKLVKFYPSLPTDWHTNPFPIIVVEREDGYHLHPSLKDKTRFAIIPEREVDRNEEFWQELKPKKVILTTEDKVGLCEGDVYYVPQRQDKDTFRGEVLEFTLGVEGYIQNEVLRFSSRENAKAYIKKYQNYITTDGHGIIKGDEFYIYDAKRHTCQRGEFGHFIDSKFDSKRYRTKKEVENLIEFNKKQYSLSDMLKVVNNWSMTTIHKEDILKFLNK